MHTVMVYKAKHPTKLQQAIDQYMNQACASYLVLNANQLANSDSQPGSIVVLGDYNKHFIYAPSNAPTGPTRNEPEAIINIVPMSDTEPGQASAACYVKALLRDRCKALVERAATIFHFQGFAADQGDEDGGGMSGGGGSASHGGAKNCGTWVASEGHQGPNPGAFGGRSGNGDGAGLARGSGGSLGTSARGLGVAAPGTGGGHGILQERSSWAEDTELHSHELVADVLKQYHSQPHVYSPLGLQHPPSNTPANEAQDWLDSMWIIAVAQPKQAHT